MSGTEGADLPGGELPPTAPPGDASLAVPSGEAAAPPVSATSASNASSARSSATGSRRTSSRRRSNRSSGRSGGRSRGGTRGSRRRQRGGGATPAPEAGSGGAEAESKDFDGLGVQPFEALFCEVEEEQPSDDAAEASDDSGSKKSVSGKKKTKSNVGSLFSTEELRAAYDVLDKDGDGVVSDSDLFFTLRDFWGGLRKGKSSKKKTGPPNRYDCKEMIRTIQAVTPSTEDKEKDIKDEDSAADDVTSDLLSDLPMRDNKKSKSTKSTKSTKSNSNPNSMSFENFRDLMDHRIEIDTDVAKLPDVLSDLLHLSFRLFDLRGSGNVSVENLIFVAKSLLGEDQATEGRIKEIVATTDLDGDGELSFGEFSAMLMRSFVLPEGS